MEINNKFTLVLISLSCLFSFSISTSTSASAPSAFSDISEAPTGSPTSAPSTTFSAQASFSFPKPETEKDVDQTLSILPGNVDPGLQKICGDTDHPVECLTTTVPFLDDKVAIEPVSILEVGIEAMNSKTKEALALATKISADPSTPKNVASALKSCIDNYNDILDSDKKVVEYINARDVYMLSMELSTNVENIHSCEDAFEEEEIESPIKEMNALLAKMISNSLAIGVDLVRF